MNAIPQKIALLGAGNLGLSIALGLVEKKVAAARDITLTRRTVGSMAAMKEQGFQVTADNEEAARQASLIMLCVQPGQLPDVMREIEAVLTPPKMLISVITGVSLRQLAAFTAEREVPIVRAMPNTAIAIGESMTCLASDHTAALEVSQQLFDALGKTVVIPETEMQAATVLGASGTAFFMRYLRAATQGGVQMGFDSKDAQLIAMQTAKGAASLILENGSHPEVEIDKVTTPQGCTIEGLNEMEHQGFSSALIKGIMTSFQRITKMKSEK